MKYKKIKPEERLPDNRKTGKDYKPFVRYRDFASSGITHRIPGAVIPRVYELMSSLERNTLVVVENKTGIVDIRDQQELSITETQEIARLLGIRHPRDPQTGELTHMTTDFVVDHITDGEKRLTAINVKYHNKTRTRRFKEKLAIETEYWKRRGGQTVVVTEKDINITVVKNIVTIRRLKEPTPAQERLLGPFLEGLTRSGYSLGAFCELFAAEHSLSFGESFYLFKLLIKRGWSGHDLEKPFRMSEKYYGCDSLL